jgi:hypothetical protein
MYDDKEIDMIFGPRAHQYVVINCALNTSEHVQAGAFAIHLVLGKTRRMLEGFTKYWGFYLVARCRRSWHPRFTRRLGRSLFE